jgi:hypothetical protein
LKRNSQLCGLWDDHTIADKTDFRLFITDYDLTTLSFRFSPFLLLMFWLR